MNNLVNMSNLKDILLALCPKERVLYFAPCNLWGGLGGSARLHNMMQLLIKLRFHVCLISYYPSNHFSITVDHPVGFDYIELAVNRNAPSWKKSLFVMLMPFLALPYVLRCNRIFAHAPSICSGFPALVVSWLFHKPLLIDHMDIKDPQTPTWMYRLILKSAQVVFCITRSLEQGLGSKAVYLPNFIDTNKFKPYWANE